MKETQDLDRLERGIEELWELGTKEGLDPFPTNFEVVPAEIMYEFGAYGIPGRFSHWTHGRTYQQIKTMYDYGLSKIYELVINTNPAYAFLLENNPVLENIVVAAHVMGHVDFFKNNTTFQDTRRDMLDSVSAHAEKIRQYAFEKGDLEVETFLNAVLALEHNVDPDIRQKSDYQAYEDEGKKQRLDKIKIGRQEDTPYDDLFKLGQKQEEQPKVGLLPVPWQDEQDLLWFIAERSQILEPWQKDILLMVRQEQLYFWPQMLTKIMNEGWAAYWHQNLIRQLSDIGFLTNGEWLDFNRMNAGVLEPHRARINPYFVGVKIWEDLDRKHKGLPLPINIKEKDRLGDVIDQSKYKGKSPSIFELRAEVPSDQAFLRDYLSDYLIDSLDLYVYKLVGRFWEIVEKDPNVIRNMLVNAMTNGGAPVIKVIKGEGKDELVLKHFREGQDLDLDYAEKVLQTLEKKLWGRPVHLITETDDKTIKLVCKDEVITKTIKDKPKLSPPAPTPLPSTWTKHSGPHPFTI